MALTDKLTSIANAIRTQTDTTDKMTLDEMPEKISKLSDISSYFNTNVRVTQPMNGNINRMFIKKLPDITLDYGNTADTNKRDAVTRLFNGYIELTEIPNVNLINCDLPYMNFEAIIGSCSKLTNIENLKKLFAKYEADSLAYLFSESALSEDIIKDIVSSIKPISQNYGTFGGGDVGKMFYNNKMLTEVTMFDTTYYNNFNQMFYYCSNLIAIINTIDMSSATRTDYMFQGCTKLETVSIKNLGKTRPSSTTLNLGISSLDKLTHTSLVGILEGLYDISQTDWTGLNLKLGSKLQSLSDEEKKIATDKGWVLS